MTLLSEALLDLELQPAGWVVPRYLTTRDHLWVEHALDEVRASVGAPADEVRGRLARPPHLGERLVAWRALGRLLLGLHGFEVHACRDPRELRRALFLRAAEPAPRPREELIVEVARELGVEAGALVRDLYADLPEERRLREASERLSAPALIERYNLCLAQGLLRRSEVVRVRVQGSARAVVRYARLHGLLCLVTRDPLGAGVVLHLSGPLSLFHHTTKYGQAMATWLPALVRAPGWELEASCRLRGERRQWRASCRDPIGTTHLPVRRFDSALEERFCRDLRRAAPRWQVLREADPVQVGAQILCPDFTLVDEERGLRVPVELVGFWTPAYLAAKLALLRRPEARGWLICLDEERAVGEQGSELPGDAPVFRFRRRVEITSFLSFLEAHLARRGGPPSTIGAAPEEGR